MRAMTPDEIEEAFLKAVCNTQNAKARWKERATEPMSDADLAEALKNELGIFGGSGGPNQYSLTYQGAGLKIWAGWIRPNHCTDKPLFEGRHTIQMARDTFGILDETGQANLFG